MKRLNRISRVIGGLAVLGNLVSAASAEENFGKFFREASSAEVNCDSLVVVEYEGKDIFQSARATLPKIDPNKCNQILVSAPLNHYLAPLIQMWEAPELDATIPENETKIERKNRIARSDELLDKTIHEVRHRVARLADICQKMTLSKSPDRTLACYFGAPEPTANKESRAIFDALAMNHLPGNEELCSEEGKPVDRASTPEFEPFTTAAFPNISWSRIKAKILDDGFVCKKFENGDPGENCVKFVLEVVFPSPDFAKQMDEKHKNHSSLLMLRKLSIESGKWNMLGPPGRGCLMEYSPTDDAIEDCGVKPQRGATEGVCMSGEDWHVWFRVFYLLNNTPRDEQ
jgi:hypothetical protein